VPPGPPRLTLCLPHLSITAAVIVPGSAFRFWERRVQKRTGNKEKGTRKKEKGKREKGEIRPIFSKG
jgi:hypothetical protein